MKNNFSPAQLALAILDRLRGAALEKYIIILKRHPKYAQDYEQLRAELTRAFEKHKPLKGIGLWTII